VPKRKKTFVFPGRRTAVSLVAAAIAVGGAADTAAQVPARPFAEERQLLDRHLAQLAEALPDYPVSDRDEALLRQLAAASGLRNVEVHAPVIGETEAIGRARRTLNATATFTDVDRFARALLGASRLVDVDEMTLRAEGGLIRAQFVLATYHFSPLGAAISPPPAQWRERSRAPTAEEAARFQRDQRRVLDKTVALDRLRRHSVSPRLFLAELGSALRDRPVALSFASFTHPLGAPLARFQIRGLVTGVGGAASLEERLLGGFFRLSDHLATQVGPCFRFESTGETPHAGSFADLPVPIEDPFRDPDPLCAADRDPPPSAPPSPVRLATGGGLALRAVDLDLVDVASALEVLTRARFVVDARVRGRVNVDISSAAFEAILAALPWRVETRGGVYVIRPADSSNGVAPPSAATPTKSQTETPGGPATTGDIRGSWQVKRAPASFVLSEFAAADPSLAAFGPKDLGVVSVFARDAAVAELFDAVRRVLDLNERRDEGRRVLSRTPESSDGGGSAPAEPITGTGDPPRSHSSREIAVNEVALAAIGRGNDGLVAFAYSPLGRLLALKVGDELSDGRIGAIESGALIVDTAEGPLRISLPALSSPPRPSR
jgi:hypothetical protein